MYKRLSQDLFLRSLFPDKLIRIRNFFNFFPTAKNIFIGKGDNFMELEIIK